MAALTALSCSDRKTAATAGMEEPEEEPLPERFENDDLPKAADEIFDDFVYYFASNEHLQRRRICFPLRMRAADGERLIGEEEWTMDSLFMTTGEYMLILDHADQRSQLGDSSLTTVTVEKIVFGGESVRQYVFVRNDGRWMLDNIREQTLDENGDASFLTFYHAFAGDSAFQHNSLSREIAFSGPDPDDDFSHIEGFFTPDSWEAFAPELPRDSIYNVVYTPQASNATEKTVFVCGIASGQEIELTFRRKKGRWKLAQLTL